MQVSVKPLLLGGICAACACALILGTALRPSAQVNSTPKTPSTPAAPSQGASNLGVYTDKEGGKHSWRINRSHALLWDEAPYIPVGGTFTPHSLGMEGDAAWQDDQRALAAIKAKSLRDVIITPSQSLPDIPLPALQRLLDYLEANDFRYGLGFGTGVKTPLSGLVIKPASYRYYEKDSLTASWQTPNMDVGLVALIETTSGKNEIANIGVVRSQGDNLTASLETPGNFGRVMALMFPHKSLPVTSEGVIPDVWSAYDSYRDRLIAYLGQVKFGKGFRFFLDPLARHLSLADETDYLIPENPSFRLEWESYINRRYPNIEEAYKAWDLAEINLKYPSDLARLIPLWANESGAPYFYDPQSGKTIRVGDVTKSQWWGDFINCRNDSLLYYMNAMANVLKQYIANVPVVYTATQTQSIFWNTAHGGYDGLALASSLRGEALLKHDSAPILSEAEQAEHPIWCVATEIGPDAITPIGSKDKTLPFASRQSLSETIEGLRGAGIKGFFVNSFQSPSGAVSAKDWLNAPDSLDWLHEYAARLDANAQVAGFLPQILFYPINSPGPAQLGPVPGTNVLWLNSFQPGQSIDWWPSYTGYVLQQEGGEPEIVLMSLQGRRETHLQVVNPKNVQAFTPNHIPVPIKVIGKNTIALTLETTPTILHTGGQSLLPPREAAEDAIAQLDGLISYAKNVGDSNSASSQSPLESAQANFVQNKFEEANLVARVELFKLVDDVTPYIWIEGESIKPGTHTFDDKPYSGSVSGGRYLKISNTNPPSKYGYGAHFPFHTYKEGRYNIWIAASPPGPEVSTIQWSLSDNLPRDPAMPLPTTPTYANGRFGWILLGTANLKAGSNTLALYVKDRAAATQKFNYSVDAIFISSRSTPPDGTNKPLPVDPASLSKKPRLPQPPKKSTTRPTR